MKITTREQCKLDGEIWKNVEWSKEYQVSNYGRVKSFKMGNTKIMKLQNHHGYKRIMLWHLGKYTNIAVHRLVAQAFIPNLDNKPYINHIDFNRANNIVENLEWCTSKENTRHAISHIFRGEQVAAHKLTTQEVINLRHEYPTRTVTRKEIAKKYNISTSTINRIISRHRWKHV